MLFTPYKEGFVLSNFEKFKKSFSAFVRKLTDPGRRRKRNLPDPSEYPEGQVPLWVSDPDHYEKKKSTSRRIFSALGTTCLILFLTFSMMGVVALGIGAAVVYSYSDPALDERFASMDLDQSSFIYALNSETGKYEVYQEIQSTSGRRVWVSDTEIPQHVKDATVAIEDKRFYSHMGVDPIRTLNAVLEYAKGYLTGNTSRASGGSTLTQQVIKNITGEDDYGITRKIKEMLQALYIERNYDKDQILEYYLNTVYFGNSAYGLSAAADVYFGKDVSELTVLEGAAIISITKGPSYYDPITKPENNKERRNTVLWMMHEQGYLTREEYDTYSVMELDLKFGEESEDNANKTDDGIFLYSYYTDMVIRDVLADLKAAGYSEAEANRLLYHGGLQIYSCVDPDIQQIMEAYFANDDNYYTSSELKKYTKEELYNKYVITVGEGEKSHEELPQVSMMVMDPETGDIVGIIGGRGEKKKSLDLNRATSSLRSPGSSIKPLSIYGYGIEHNLFSLGSPLDDVPVITDAKNKTMWPSNYNGKYAGLVSVKKALSWSLNAPAAQALQMVGITTAFDFVVDTLHLSTLVNDDKSGLAPLSVGALTDGVTLREMVTAYTVFAGEGKYAAYRSYTHVVSYEGKTLLEKPVDRETVFGEDTAFLVTDILEYALETGGSSDAAKLDGIDTAGKSGTTSFYKDRWFIGYTPEYLGGIWWGYDTQTTLDNTHHVTMWHDIMEMIHEAKQITSAKFEVPSNVSKVSVCWKSGMSPGPYCSEDKCVSTFYYKNEMVPTETCTVHHQLNVCTLSGNIAHEGCPTVEKKTFVDIERSFKFAISISDAGTICPRLTAANTLYSGSDLPAYALMVPDGLFPSYSSSGANCICTAHIPSDNPHYNEGTVSTDPSTDSSQGTSDTQNPSDTTDGGGGGNGETSDET